MGCCIWQEVDIGVKSVVVNKFIVIKWGIYLLGCVKLVSLNLEEVLWR